MSSNPSPAFLKALARKSKANSAFRNALDDEIERKEAAGTAVSIQSENAVFWYCEDGGDIYPLEMEVLNCCTGEVEQLYTIHIKEVIKLKALLDKIVAEHQVREEEG